MAFAHETRADQSDPDGVHEARLSQVAAGYCPIRQNKYFTIYPIWNICSILIPRLAHVKRPAREGER